MFKILAILLAIGSTEAASPNRPVKKMRASEYSCAEISQAIRQFGAVQLTFGPFGNTFFSRPSSCYPSMRAVQHHFRAKGGERCYMGWACEWKNER